MTGHDAKAPDAHWTLTTCAMSGVAGVLLGAMIATFRAFSSEPESQKGIPKRACHVIHVSPASAGGDDGLAAGSGIFAGFARPGACG